MNEKVRERKEELLKAFEGADDGVLILIDKLVEEAVYLEGSLDYLKSFPVLDKLGRATPSGKVYASYISRFADIVNRLAVIQKRFGEDEDTQFEELLKGIEKIGGLGAQNRTLPSDEHGA